MKHFLLTLSALAISAAFSPVLAAEDFSITSDMQRCTSDSDCGLISNDCSKDCGFVAVNSSAVAALQKAFSITCSKPMGAASCGATKAACVSGLCTAKMANADAMAKPQAEATPTAPTEPTAPTPQADYKAGAYNVSEPATPNQVKGDYKDVNDKKGDFSAYNLPQGEVKQKTVGTIVDKIYVPADAPVKGGLYVPVTEAGAAAAPAAPVAPTAPMPSAAAPVPAPAPAAAPVATPAAPVVPPSPAPVAPQSRVMPAPAPVPMANRPSMTPSKPNQMPPGLAPVEPIVPSAAKAMEEKSDTGNYPMPTTPDAMVDKSEQGVVETAKPFESEYKPSMDETISDKKAISGVSDAPMTEYSAKVKADMEPVPTAPTVKKSFSIKTNKKENEWNMN